MCEGGAESGLPLGNQFAKADAQQGTHFCGLEQLFSNTYQGTFCLFLESFVYWSPYEASRGEQVTWNLWQFFKRTKQPDTSRDKGDVFMTDYLSGSLPFVPWCSTCFHDNMWVLIYTSPFLAGGAGALNINFSCSTSSAGHVETDGAMLAAAQDKSFLNLGHWWIAGKVAASKERRLCQWVKEGTQRNRKSNR